MARKGKLDARNEVSGRGSQIMFSGRRLFSLLFSSSFFFPVVAADRDGGGNAGGTGSWFLFF